MTTPQTDPTDPQVSLHYHMETRLQNLLTVLTAMENRMEEHWKDHQREHNDHKESHAREHTLTQTAIDKAEKTGLGTADQVSKRLDEKTSAIEARVSDLRDLITELRGRDRGIGMAWGVAIAGGGLILAVLGYLASQ